MQLSGALLLPTHVCTAAGPSLVTQQLFRTEAVMSQPVRSNQPVRRRAIRVSLQTSLFSLTSGEHHVWMDGRFRGLVDDLCWRGEAGPGLGEVHSQEISVQLRIPGGDQLQQLQSPERCLLGSQEQQKTRCWSTCTPPRVPLWLGKMSASQPASQSGFLLDVSAVFDF